jgi:hypothetical protein
MCSRAGDSMAKKSLGTGMSDHEDILMGMDAVSDRLNDADQLVRATRASYLQVAQKHFVLQEKVRRIREICEIPEFSKMKFASEVLRAIDGV